ncbi:putative protein lysine methyltransferase SET6 [Cercospora zeina]
MTIPVSELWTVQRIDNAGRGVVARRPILKDTVILRSGPPVVHVIFKKYAKETCAHCFLWDRGRTLRERENELGKVFCSDGCRSQWLAEQGSDGVEAWRTLTAFVRAKASGGHGGGGDASMASMASMAEGAKPSEDTIRLLWQKADAAAHLLRRARAKSGVSKQERKTVHAIQQQLGRDKDADTLAYFLSGLLLERRAASEQARRQFLALAMDDTPYSTQQALEASCAAFLQLVALLPAHLVHLLTPQLCLNLVRADNHNAFGIRAGGEDGEEYMGYAVYPAASYFNHSCDANVHKTRHGSEWEFRSARDIAPGEQLCITYLGGDEAHLDLGARRSRLQDPSAHGTWHHLTFFTSRPWSVSPDLPASETSGSFVYGPLWVADVPKWAGIEELTNYTVHEADTSVGLPQGTRLLEMHSWTDNGSEAVTWWKRVDGLSDENNNWLPNPLGNVPQ